MKYPLAIAATITFLTTVGFGLSPSGEAAIKITQEKGVKVITLNQVACQFLESEQGKDHNYTTTQRADCQKINGETLAQREKNFESLRLPPGEYIFRVKNLDVPYELGFWLRGAGVGRAILPSVSGGGVLKGQSQDFRVTLRPGRYVYSCPLNPTPDYPLLVE